MKTKIGSVTALMTTLLMWSPTFAQEEGAQPEREVSQASITISPFHLAMPLYEFTGEHRLAPQVGVALIGGVGSFEFLGDAGTALLWEAGASFRYYALGHFDHGMQIGAEIIHLGISFDSSDDGVDVSGAGIGTSLGPFVGYKFVASFGFTVEIQLGYQTVMVSTEASASAGEIEVSESESETGSGVLLNVNAGWSF